MSETLKSSIYKSYLLASGLPELDRSSFTRHVGDFSNGVRAVLTKGSLTLHMSGKLQMKMVVLKTINDQFANGLNESRRGKLLQYFDREAGIWRHVCHHSNILELYGFMMLPDDPFPSLVSPYCPDGDLRKFVGNKKNRALSSQIRINLVCDIARGLDFLHNLTPVIIHRDVRAKNVLVRNEHGTLSAVLIDFGSAKLLDTELFSILNSTHINYKAWSPPEYILDDANYANPTTHGDIWSLACTCLETFTAQDPFPEEYDFDDELDQGHHPPDFWKEYGGISEVLWEFLLKCWAGEPEDRPSAGAVVRKLQALAVEM